MSIENLEIHKKLFLAPMAEVSYEPLRRVSRDHGAGCTFTQMVSADGVIKNKLETLRYLVFNKSEKPIGVQILGNKPDLIGDAVGEIVSYKPDVIDLNCGCSVSNVCNMKMGCGLMDNPALIGQIVRKMVDAAGNVPVSVKMRLGPRKNIINCVDIAKIAEDNGASLVFVHARTREDSYLVPPRWELLKNVKDEVSIPVVGNGSAFTVEDVIKIKETTGVDSVMIARGALGNPFIFSRYQSIIENGTDPGEPTIDDVLKSINSHIKYSVDCFGEKEGVLRSRKHVIWYLRKYNGISSLIDRIFSITDRQLLEEFISEHIEKIKNNAHPEEDINLINEKFSDRVIFWSQT